MKALRIAVLTLAATLALTAANDSAIAEPAAEPLALRKVMKELGSNMQAVTDGISREDWMLIEKTAPLIAEHPQPPLLEKMRIMSFMGGNMARFKAYDGETHQAAMTLGQAAKGKDAPAAIAAFQVLQTACHACHRDFRKPFLQHFYEER
jgi:cytochrome c556